MICCGRHACVWVTSRKTLSFLVRIPLVLFPGSKPTMGSIMDSLLSGAWDGTCQTVDRLKWIGWIDCILWYHSISDDCVWFQVTPSDTAFSDTPYISLHSGRTRTSPNPSIPYSSAFQQLPKLTGVTHLTSYYLITTCGFGQGCSSLNPKQKLKRANDVTLAIRELVSGLKVSQVVHPRC